jgi:hypothetical protein
MLALSNGERFDLTEESLSPLADNFEGLNLTEMDGVAIAKELESNGNLINLNLWSIN